MAKLAVKKGLLASLPEAKAEGTIYITTDERGMYVDVDDSTRIRIGDFIEVDDVAALETEKEKANLSQTALYYCKKENVLAKYNGTSFVEINRDTDTGATVAANTGAGYISAAESPTLSYDASSRTMTLTIPKALITKEAFDAKVGEIAPDTTIKKYIDDAIAGIESGESDLEGRVESLETTIKTKANQTDVTNLTSKVQTLEGTVGDAESGLVKDVNDLKTKVGTDTVAKQIQDAIDELAIDTTYATKEELGEQKTRIDTLVTTDTQQTKDIAALQESIKGLSGAMHFKGTVEKDPASMATEGYGAGDVVIWGDKEYVFNGTNFVEFGDVSQEGTRLTALETWKAKAEGQITALETASGTHALKTDLTAETERATAAEKKALTDAKAYTDEKIAALDLGINWGTF